MRVVNFPDPEDIAVAKHGPEPEFDPVNNQADALVSETINKLEPEVDDLRQKVFEAEAAKQCHTHPVLLSGAIEFVVMAELASAFLILESVGVENPEKTILAATLSLFILVITDEGFKSGGEE